MAGVYEDSGGNSVCYHSQFASSRIIASQSGTQGEAESNTVYVPSIDVLQNFDNYSQRGGPGEDDGV